MTLVGPSPFRQEIRPAVSQVDRLAFIGDLCPRTADPVIGLTVSPALRGLLARSDLLTANIECPLTLAPPSKTGGVVLRSRPEGIEALSSLGIGLAVLANNHISDCGDEGLADTVRALADRGIPIVGAGQTSDEASAPFIFQGDSGTFAFLASSYTDPNTPSMAGKDTAGANPVDLERTLEQTRELREAGCQVIVIFHGGWEYYRIPSPRHRALMQAFSRAGASLVVGHHCHVFLGHESTPSGLVFHGLGDFFLHAERNQSMQGTGSGLALMVEMDGEGPVAFTTYFVTPDYDDGCVSLVSGNSAVGLRQIFDDSSRVLIDEREYRKAWRKECARNVFGFNERGGPSIRGSLRKAGRSLQYLGKLRATRGPSGQGRSSGRSGPAPSLQELARDALLGLPYIFEDHFNRTRLKDPDRVVSGDKVW